MALLNDITESTKYGMMPTGVVDTIQPVHCALAAQNGASVYNGVEAVSQTPSNIQIGLRITGADYANYGKLNSVVSISGDGVNRTVDPTRFPAIGEAILSRFPMPPVMLVMEGTGFCYGRKCGTLILYPNAALVPTDGQHRLGGMKYALNSELGRALDIGNSFQFLAQIGLDWDEETASEVSYVVNSTQERLTGNEKAVFGSKVNRDKPYGELSAAERRERVVALAGEDITHSFGMYGLLKHPTAPNADKSAIALNMAAQAIRPIDAKTANEAEALWLLEVAMQVWDASVAPLAESDKYSCYTTNEGMQVPVAIAAAFYDRIKARGWDAETAIAEISNAIKRFQKRRGNALSNHLVKPAFWLRGGNAKKHSAQYLNKDRAAMRDALGGLIVALLV